MEVAESVKRTSLLCNGITYDRNVVVAPEHTDYYRNFIIKSEEK
jgi:hypothetical protein